MIAASREMGIGAVSALVKAAGWHGDNRSIVQALPHETQNISAQDLLQTMLNLGISVQQASGRLNETSAKDCPFIFVENNDQFVIVLDRNEDGALVYQGNDTAPTWQKISKNRGSILLVSSEADKGQVESKKSFFNIVRNFKGQIASLFLAALVTNCLAFAAPVFIMVAYDRVLPANSLDLLMSLLIGMAVVLTTDAFLRKFKTQAVAYIGRKVERQMGLDLFNKLMSLPLAQLQKSDVGQQISRLKQFEGTRDIFAGSSLNSALDLPFTLLFLYVIFSLAPDTGWMVLALCGLFALGFLLGTPIQRALGANAAKARMEYQNFLMELTKNQRAIQRLGIRERWLQRHEALAAVAAETARKVKQFSMFNQIFGQSLMMFAGAGAVVHGTRSAMAGDMTLGGLIASMTLVWRVLAPIHALYGAAPAIAGFKQSITQVDRVLDLPEELRRGARPSQFKSFQGNIVVSGASFRYSAVGDPVLTGVSLNAAAGSVTVIAGPNGSGKSTLLNMLDGLYAPTSGTVQIDGIDYRQIACDDLRVSISYVPQYPEFFHGTVAQNFRLTHPLATEEEIWAAIRSAGLSEEVRSFPEGINTRLTENFRQKMSGSVAQGLALARGFVKAAPIYIFDEPCNGLDDAKEAAFLAKLAELKGAQTVFLTTGRPSHFKYADRIIYLDRGRVLIDDTADAAAKKINALSATNGRD